MKRKHKTYSRPKRPFDKIRIDEEAKIKKEFGLKNKKEIWKVEAKIKSMREKAKRLISAGPEEQQVLFDSLKKIGFEVSSIGDILALDKKDFLKRRLQTVLVDKKLASTIKGARQLITHKKVLIKENVVNRPSYIVPVDLEGKITLKVMKKKPKPQDEAKPEVKEEKSEGESKIEENKEAEQEEQNGR